MLEGVLQGKGDLDGLAVGLAALFAHHYGAQLDALIAFVRAHKTYIAPLFVVAMARHQSVRDFVARHHHPAKVRAFTSALQVEIQRLVANTVSVDGFVRRARDLWRIS